MTGLVIGDDHSVFLDAMSAVLVQRGYEVTVARSVADTIETVRRTRPDVCLIDRHFAGDNGITAIIPMLAASSRTKVLVLSADPDTEGIRQALHAGASGYLHKTRGVSALTRAIDRVQRGEVVVDVPKPSPARPAARQDDAHRLAAFLTARERECLQLLVEGLDTAGIATKLGVSPATVRTHIQSLMIKLGVHSRLEAASYAVRYRLLEDEVLRFPSTGTGLAGRQRRRTDRPANARPAAARRPARPQSMTRRARLGGQAHDGPGGVRRRTAGRPGRAAGGGGKLRPGRGPPRQDENRHGQADGQHAGQPAAPCLAQFAGHCPATIVTPGPAATGPPRGDALCPPPPTYPSG
jgi:two-component system, NarL family, nitrate/nitrite response regulator NarL